jgi:hypothetical protein
MSHPVMNHEPSCPHLRVCVPLSALLRACNLPAAARGDAVRMFVQEQVQVLGEKRQALVPIPGSQQQRINFAPLNSASSSHQKTSLLEENRSHLQRERELQARFRAAAADQRNQREKQGQEVRKGGAGSSAAQTRSSLAQSLLCPKATAEAIVPASLLESISGASEPSLTPEGLDLESAKKLYMPAHGREYQRAVVQTAVMHNTLVSLPTGMGKTFVGAVLMFNYLRWFPKKIVIFLAPTKPLAKQQVDAVYQNVGIPPEITTVMTGDLLPDLRKERWRTCRAFFMTPQVFENDVSTQICDVSRIALVVVDEAHKAVGQHSIVKALAYVHDHLIHTHRRPIAHLSVPRGGPMGYRILALTATPGMRTYTATASKSVGSGG